MRLERRTLPQRLSVSGNDHRAPQVLLEHRPEHKAEEERGGLALELHEVTMSGTRQA
jgi:hypothetical protein